jgi:hypothetical protein
MKRKRLFTTITLAVTLLWGVLSLMNVKLATAEPAHDEQLQAVRFPDQRDAVQRAVNWLVGTHQNDDGGYSSFSTGANQAASDVGGTLDAILAISSAGYDSIALAPGQENSPLAYLDENRAQTIEYASFDSGQAGKLVLALVAGNQDPRDFGDTDYVAILLNQLDFSGQFNVENAFGQSLAILALSAAHEPVPEMAVRWLLNQQSRAEGLEGSWDDGYGTAGNTDATAMSIMALASTQLTITNDSLTDAADFLWRARLDSGSWEYGAGFGASVNSTALAVQALGALGLDFYSPGGSGVSPMSALLSWQGESGAFQADFGDGPFDDFFSTVQALPAASGKPYPLFGRYLAGLQAADCLATLQDPLTGGWEQFAGFGVDAAGTSRAIQAIAALGEDPAAARWTVNGINAVQALESMTDDYVANSGGGGIGIVLQAVVAAGGNVHDFAGLDLVLEMSHHLSPTGEYDDTTFGPFSHAEAMMGLLAAGAEADPSATEWLMGAHSDGDWGGADSTGIALNVLGQLGLAVPEAIDVLHLTQESDGGWGFGQSNPSSSSEVVQGLVAIGENPFAPAWSQIVSGTLTNAADVILSQQAENGCWPNLFGEGDDPFGTTDAIVLLAQRPGWQAALAEPVADVTDSLESTVEPITVESIDSSATLQPTLEPTELPEATEMPEPTEALVETPEAVEVAENVAEATTPTAEVQPQSNSNSVVIIVVIAVALLLVAGLVFRFRKR